jgi:hypothetical protein
MEAGVVRADTLQLPDQASRSSGTKEGQASRQAQTFANSRQSVPKARDWPVTKETEPQASSILLSLPGNPSISKKKLQDSFLRELTGSAG